MTMMLNKDAREDLMERGYSRRQIAEVAALVGAGVAASSLLGGAAQAQQQAARGVAGAVRIGSNECWTGPFPSGVDAAAKAAALGNWYDPDNYRGDLVKTVASVEGIPESHVMLWPGSGGPLVSTVAAFCSPTKGLVTADPTFESAWRTADYLKAPIAKAPQAPGAGHDVKAMLAANPNAGLYYICTPNNPTGTVTPLADIEWLLANKPKDSVLLVDEAYIHFSEAPSAAKLVAGRKDLVVMRTFSKLFGMAGVRLGLTFADPELQKRIMLFGPTAGGLSITAMACGNAVYPEAALIKARREEMIANREETIAWLTKKGIDVQTGSQANMFMMDWKKPAKEMQAAMLATPEKVQIGRNWPIWPTVSRVTVGSAEDMAKFRAAVEKVYTA
ncbi:MULTISPECIES: pyridoxal phosphate-dependent aminotransferase [Sphingobium]|jgi:histidinol-phosphate aminotransferase|uniref:pyridoxal phosphate-dependent aminotransferase n=1 Tax=Sphingobium TaxID=165695 RepID=UPI000C426800|nr:MULTISPECIES: pyridoxal phosphate-dependent aminotransferase [Sphingobium]MAX15241.1 aminotransferase [Sphingobium sp.]MBS47890.1 aminotransferase [Sphingobium sp.]MCC4255638.1 pyridoxal phosphate-dependent aminotransferase [Sphingobium lactosutens]MEE2741134.1 pyridoxal phosphate-dependent aminotransferase [Pseudomonadota bacterium]|tara:strand:+ start:1092 stop:2258 length:1167 start_codon:yes stop_codon:yes gene_type:complete